MSSIGVTRTAHLSPKSKKLYDINKAMKASFSTFKYRQLRHKRKLSCFTKEEIFRDCTEKLQPHVRRFIRSQLESVGKAPHGRRFTVDDKVLAILLQKQSNRAYNTLRKLFCLPSPKTLRNLLKNMPLPPGINDTIFKGVESTLAGLEDHQKVCVILFDEISLQPHLSYNSYKHEFEGLEDCGNVKTKHIANCAQVFMLTGLASKWKQPIAYTFSKGPTKSIALANMLERIIKRCQEASFKVVASISDQGSNNQAAINLLMKRTAPENQSPYLKYYFVNDKRINHLYDPPHLIKGIRNNLLKYNLVWEENGNKHVACWADIEKSFAIDNGSGELRLLPKITEVHINPKKIRKMKVSCATQVFSHNFAAVVNLLATTGMYYTEFVV